MIKYITIKKNGEAKELKLISVSRVYENDFKKIYPNILKKITHWKPATNIRTGKAVKYDLNIEIEFQKGDYKLVIYNNDIQKLLTTSLSLDQ